MRVFREEGTTDLALVARYRDALEELAEFAPHRRVFVYVHYVDADHEIMDDRLRDQSACDAYVIARLREDVVHARERLAARLREVGTIAAVDGTWVLDGIGRPSLLDSCSRDLALLEDSC